MKIRGINLTKWVWYILTLPMFLALVPVATIVSLFDGRDVFPAAHYWTHAVFFGHRWMPYEEVPPDWEWQTCSFCGKMRATQKT